ncbi:SdrD B-like domain-containing protein [Candidatus Thiothrix anitrata]|uniref:DUF11 domain-containing protein n=1 Tax=Candidatus Thiothrix anitrata TaxID=2823902 RepID=A0ABX7X2Z1_9GAMM|nr:SdrD B-like domain-containing protein [Candidatus Thiothrix anitrata]QTR50272.1 DUF11 domain-containing protein [Candidatus Thiothrix anitrata]
MQNKKHLWLGVLGATLLIPNAAFADISGKVFRDFNANGVFDTSANFSEVGFAGATVKAFDATGTQVATTTSGADGAYTLTGLTSGADYRVEFSWAESWLKPGTAGGTATQFVKDGASNINMALNNPLDYSQPNDEVAVSVAIVGPTNQPVAAGRDYRNFGALVKFPITATGKPASPWGDPASPGYVAPTTLATHQQIGSTSGAAYQRENKHLFVAAYAKRAVGFGSGGPGAIYRIEENGTVALHATIPDAGSDIHDFSGDYTQITYDTAAVPSVGKSSLGDMEISPDGQSLYVVNLNNRHLYSVSTQNPNAVTDLGEITRPSSCPSEDFRPFGLGMDESGSLYIGTVCSNQSLSLSHSFAVVLKYNGAGSYSEALNINLNFSHFWGRWSDALNASYPSQTDSGLQPMLSDISFHGKDMVLAFRNRQWEVSYIPGGSNPSMAHVLKACWQAGAWSLESNGECGGVTGALPNYNIIAENGPGGGYFFDMRDVLATFGGQPVINALGSLTIIPGGNIIATLADPLDLISGGVRQLNPSTGVASMEYQIFRGSADGSNGGGDGGYFGKTSGLGDLELLPASAPIEIGNRVWLDTNGNGIQDAGENGIPGISVELRSGATVLTTATTAADGTYYFSSATGTDTASVKYGLTQLQPNTAYTVKFPTSVDVSGTTYNLTTANAGGNRLIDSNAAATGDVVVNATDIPTSGANNHSFDVGYSSMPPPTGCTTITNNASITQSGVSDPVAGNNNASAAIQANCVTPKTDLKLVKTASKTTVRKGDTLTYTLVLENESDVDATGVVVNDKLPAALTYVDHAPAVANYDSVSGNWTVGTVPANQTVTLSISVTVN